MCGETKPLPDFHRSSQAKNGHQGRCKPCARKAAREYYAKNRERQLALCKAWKLANAEKVAAYRQRDRQNGKAAASNLDYRNRHPERALRQGRESYAKHRKQRQQAQAAQRAANPEKVKAQSRKHYESHRERFYQRNQERRARERNAGGRGVTAAQWREILRLADNRCAYCGTRAGKLTMDHIQPLSRGGEHDPMNVIPCCSNCNTIKRTSPAPRPVQISYPI